MRHYLAVLVKFAALTSIRQDTLTPGINVPLTSAATREDTVNDLVTVFGLIRVRHPGVIFWH
jgi:hypothetical protein